MKVDSFDIRILETLQEDASLSHQQVAERVGLSPSPCSRRIRLLHEAGIIAATVVRLSPGKTNRLELLCDQGSGKSN